MVEVSNYPFTTSSIWEHLISFRLTTLPLLCRLSVWDIRISVITVQIMRCVSRFMSLTTSCRPNQYKGLGWFGRGRGWRGVRNETHSAFTVVPLTLVPSWSKSLPFICNRNLISYSKLIQLSIYRGKCYTTIYIKTFHPLITI